MAQVLIVDDEISAREQLYETLTRHGYQAMTASSGDQAIKLLHTTRPDLILLDSAMPGLSGLETARRIRSFDLAVPVVLVSEASEPEVPADELSRLRIDTVLRKGSDIQAIVDSVGQSLSRTQRTAEPSSGPTDRRFHGTLLVVDDDPKVTKIFTAFFESRGMRVIAAGSGEEALKALAQQPHLVLLDVNMPGMDGVLTLKKIKERHPKLPVIMVSGVEEEASGREALKIGKMQLSAPESITEKNVNAVALPW